MSKTNGSNAIGGREPGFYRRWAVATRVGNPARRLVLMGLAGHAEGNTGYGWVIPEYLADFAECSVATVQSHLNALERASVIARRREYRGGKRTEDAFLLLADDEAAWPGDEPLVREAASHTTNGHGPGGVLAKPSAVTRVPVRVEVPNFDELGGWQQRVLMELRRFADAKEASLDEMKALAACRDFADRDHIGAAEKFAAWWIEGKGASRARSDANATWRTWLKNSDPISAARRAAPPGDLDKYEFGEAE
jgi:hypothetical protein